MKKCNLCGYEFDENNIEESIETHLKNNHFIDYKDYYEISKLTEPNISCWKCGGDRYILNPYLDIYLHCKNCLTKKNITEIQENLFTELLGYQDRIGKSKYYQYFLSLSPKQRGNLFPKNFEKLSEILGDLKKISGIRFDKTNLITVENVLGTSSEISERNKKNLVLKEYSSGLIKLSPECYKLEFTPSKYIYIYMPEVINYDYRHHARHSILNANSTRNTKRIKLNSGECLKFYSTTNNNVKSILSIKNSENNPVSFFELSDFERFKLKFEILKTKEIREKILEIYNEIWKFTEKVCDSVFILNTADLPYLSCKSFEFNLNWSSEEYQICEENKKIIKLSIV